MCAARFFRNFCSQKFINLENLEQQARKNVTFTSGGLSLGCKYFSSGFIFTTSLPPCVAAGAYTSIRHLKFSSSEREKLFKVVKELKFQLKKYNIPFLKNDSPIIPVMIGDPILCKKASQKLHALSRVSHYIDIKKRRTIMRAFINSQFGYCPLVWMFHSRTLNNRQNTRKSLTYCL